MGAEFTIEFDDSALRTGEMDIRQLAPALQSLSELVEQANDALNNGSTEVSLRARAGFRKGSFGIDLDLTLGVIHSLLVGNGYRTAEQILSSLGFSGTVKGVIQLLKFAEGRKPKKVTFEGNDNVVVEFGDGARGNTIIVNQNVYQLAQEPGVRRALKSTLDPLSAQGIDEVRVISGKYSKRKKPVALVKKADLPSFETRSAVVDPSMKASIESSEYTQLLELRGLRFDDERQWLFSDGSRALRAPILDEDFMDSIHARSIRFGEGDKIRAVVRQEQWQEGNRLRIRYSVVKVKAFFPAVEPRQIKLIPEENDE